MLTRVATALGLLGLVVAALALRLAAAPTAQAYRVAIAPAPAGAVYLAARGGLEVVGPTGAIERRGALPAPSPLALAAEGESLLLGAEGGAYASADGGRTWSREPLPWGRYNAVAMAAGRRAAAAWGRGLWLADGGAWRQAELPAGDTEVAAISLGAVDLVATLLGVDRSDDHRSFRREPALPGRVTAVAGDPGGAQGAWAATWRGDVYGWSGNAWRLLDGVGAGVWAVSPAAAGQVSGLAIATTAGLRLPSGRALDGREVVALARSGPNLYAALAGRELLVGPAWRRVAQG